MIEKKIKGLEELLEGARVVLSSSYGEKKIYIHDFPVNLLDKEEWEVADKKMEDGSAYKKAVSKDPTLKGLVFFG